MPHQNSHSTMCVMVCRVRDATDVEHRCWWRRGSDGQQPRGVPDAPVRLQQIPGVHRMIGRRNIISVRRNNIPLPHSTPYSKANLFLPHITPCCNIAYLFLHHMPAISSITAALLHRANKGAAVDLASLFATAGSFIICKIASLLPHTIRNVNPLTYILKLWNN